MGLLLDLQGSPGRHRLDFFFQHLLSAQEGASENSDCPLGTREHVNTHRGVFLSIFRVLTLSLTLIL